MRAKQLLRWLRTPLWIAALATGAKSFVDNPVLGSRRLNRSGLYASRIKLAHRLAWSRRRRLAEHVPQEWREQFDRDGFVLVRNCLPPEVFAALQDRILNGEWPTRTHLQGDTFTRRVAVDPALLRAVPELGQALAQPGLGPLFHYVASSRVEPLFYIQTISAGVVDAPPDPQLHLHSDTFHPSLKAWLFLTDVEPDGRPLTYVRGSHRLTPERLAWQKGRALRFTELDMLSQRGSLRVETEELPGLGLEEPVAFAVPANTLVVADMFGFHARGDSDRPTLRVELWAYTRPSPFVPWAGFGLLSRGLLAHRRAVWLARIVDRLDRWGVRKQHWRPAGLKRPIDP
jgi:hypothetical protein